VLWLDHSNSRYVIAVFWRSLKLGLGDAGAITAEAGIVFERLPGQRIMVVADAEKAAKVITAQDTFPLILSIMTGSMKRQTFNWARIGSTERDGHGDHDTDQRLAHRAESRAS
jgi:hypothetical protein